MDYRAANWFESSQQNALTIYNIPGDTEQEMVDYFVNWVKECKNLKILASRIDFVERSITIVYTQ